MDDILSDQEELKVSDDGTDTDFWRGGDSLDSDYY